jgi:hypothetical protein
MEYAMCENIVKFIREQHTKKRRDMFLNLIKGFASDDQFEGFEIIMAEVEPIIKRDDIRDMIMSCSDDLFKIIPFKKILNELQPTN